VHGGILSQTHPYMHSHKTKTRKHRTLSHSQTLLFSLLKETKKIMQMWNVQFKHGTATHLGVEMGKRVSSSLPSVRIKQHNQKSSRSLFTTIFIFLIVFLFWGIYERNCAGGKCDRYKPLGTFVIWIIYTSLLAFFSLAYNRKCHSSNYIY
jgi:hypothetical protein